MNRFFSYLLATLLGCIITVLALWFFPSKNQPSFHQSVLNRENRAVNTEPEPANLSPLQKLLQEKQQTIIELEQQIEWLQNIIDQLQSNGSQQPANHSDPRQPQQLWFDADALLKSGMDKWDVAKLKELVESIELKKLELINRATREGWSHSGKLYKDLREIDQQFLSNLDNEQLDAVLFATGKNNRVQITDVLSDSAADFAGILPGDIILSYADHRVFDATTLQQLTTTGTAGEMIAIKLKRGTELVTVYVPRGSLGTRFKATRQAPQ